MYLVALNQKFLGFIPDITWKLFIGDLKIHLQQNTAEFFIQNADPANLALIISQYTS